MVNREILQKKAFPVKETPIMSIYVKTPVFGVKRTLTVYFRDFACFYMFLLIFRTISLNIRQSTFILSIWLNALPSSRSTPPPRAAALS